MPPQIGGKLYVFAFGIRDSQKRNAIRLMNEIGFKKKRRRHSTRLWQRIHQSRASTCP